MNKLVPVLLLFFIIQESQACCQGGAVSITPRNQAITQNPVILIDFMERDYEVYEQLDDARIYLVDDKGRAIDLEIVEQNKGFKTLAQVLLKPQKKLKMGATVSLRISNFQQYGDKQKAFVKKIQPKKWRVVKRKDNRAPEFIDDISYEYYNESLTAYSHGFKVKVAYKDNQVLVPEVYDHIFVEVTNEEGKRYISTVIKDSFSIYQGMCGSTFEMKYDAKSKFALRLMDLSGNMSRDTQEIKYILSTRKVIDFQQLKKE